MNPPPKPPRVAAAEVIEHIRGALDGRECFVLIGDTPRARRVLESLQTALAMFGATAAEARLSRFWFRSLKGSDRYAVVTIEKTAMPATELERYFRKVGGDLDQPMGDRDIFTVGKDRKAMMAVLHAIRDGTAEDRRFKPEWN